METTQQQQQQQNQQKQQKTDTKHEIEIKGRLKKAERLICIRKKTSA